MQQTFVIRSLWVQNTAMLLSLGVVVFLFGRFLLEKKPRHTLVCFVWILLVLWFFNSRFFGFSVVRVTPSGIEIHYGVLSWRNTVLPIHTPWRIENRFSGIRKTGRLYFLKIDGHESMKVKGRKDLELLQAVGKAIDRMNARESAGLPFPGGTPGNRYWPGNPASPPSVVQGSGVPVFLSGAFVWSCVSPTRQLFRSHVEMPNFGKI